jgi:chromosome segregation ATPase
MDQETLKKSKQKSVIEADIVLLEQKHNKLLTSLESANSAHSKQLDYYRKEIETLIKQKRQLDLEIQSLTQNYTELSKKGETLRSSMQDFETKEVSRVESIAAKLYTEAQDVLQAAYLRSSEANKREEDLKTREIELKVKEDDNLKQSLANEERKKELDIEAQNSKIAIAQAHQAIKSLLDQKQEIERKIAESQGLLDKLLKQVDDKHQELGQLIQQVMDIKAQMAIRESKLQAREDEVIKRENKVNQKEIWVADREQTVGRSYKELINKGGDIANG